MEVTVEAGGEAQTDVQPERRAARLLRQQRALLSEAWSIMGKRRGAGEREADGDGEARAQWRGEGRDSADTRVAF